VIINKEYFEIINDFGDVISGDLYYSDTISGKNPLVIVSHGFKGFKDWGFLPYLSKCLAQKNCIVICINFSLNGKPDENLIITKPEDFARNTVTREKTDIKKVIESFISFKEPLFDKVIDYWNGKTFLFGHSLGAGVSLLTAMHNPMIYRVALWSSIAKFDRYTERQKKEWKKTGYMEFVNQRTNQPLKMNVSYLEDIEVNAYDLPSQIPDVNFPLLLIHGKQDVTVPLKEAQMLIDTNKYHQIKYHFIENTGHTFGIEQPFTKPTVALEEAISKTLKFFGL